MKPMEIRTERPYHHGDLRSAILDTAMRMMSEDGGWQFTLREVARRAGVSHAAPYKHFPDKAALLAEIALIGFDRLGKALRAARLTSDGDLAAEFAAISEAYLAFGRDNPALYRLMFGGNITGAIELHRDPRALEAFGAVIGLLERGQASGLFRARPVRGQAAACWAQMHGLTMLKLDGLLLPEKVGEDAIEAALETLREGLLA
jgi:AcrR family transcriptional regulator